MKHYKYGIVILHYKTEKETIECAKSILNLDGADDAIVLVVDNASGDNSLDIIKSKFNGYSNVIYLQNNDNIGFSRANNRAYRLLKEKYSVEYIVLLNNDTVIKQNDFLKIIVEISKMGDYAVLGPDVFAPTSKTHQNPLFLSIPSITELDSEIQRKKNQLNDLSLAEKQFEKIAQRNRIRSKIPYFILELKAKIFNRNDNLFFKYKNPVENPVLMGACLIFCPKFVSKLDEVFMPETQFYYEELILAQRCKKLNLKTLYTPELKILHYDGAATHNSNKNLSEYISFTINQTIESYEIYKRYVCQDN